MSFPQVRTSAGEYPATILKMLGIELPISLSSVNTEIASRFSPKSIVVVMIDNFGLFEAVVYKPEGLIKNMEVLAVIESEDPYAASIIKNIISGNPLGGFNVLEYAQDSNLVVRAVCREDDRETFDFDRSYTISVRDDMSTYIESTKHVFKCQLLYIHFLDFESLYAQYGHRTPPKKLLEKIVKRTDNWIKVLYKQARPDTLFMVIGNHGRHPIPLNYEGKLAEWRKANAPIAIMFQKRES